jgi:hypothetical protein
MRHNDITDRRELLVRRIGLFIAIIAMLMLLALTAYRVPLFHDELNGVIVGISEVHNEAGSELVAAVQLESGEQILVYMPADLLNSASNNVRINEGRTLLGRKSYRIITYSE